jgi:hypothetical protein
VKRPGEIKGEGEIKGDMLNKAAFPWSSASPSSLFVPLEILFAGIQGQNDRDFLAVVEGLAGRLCGSDDKKLCPTPGKLRQPGPPETRAARGISWIPGFPQGIQDVPGCPHF